MNADRNPKMLWEVLAEIISENNQFKSDFELHLIGKVDVTVVNDIQKYKLEKKGLAYGKKRMEKLC